MNSSKCLSLILFFSTLLSGFKVLAFEEPSPAKLKALYNSLEPCSISQHLAFYDLYPNSIEGQNALQNVNQLLTGDRSSFTHAVGFQTPFSTALQAIINLVNKSPDEPLIELFDHELNMIEKLANRLPNRHLTGYGVETEEEILHLEPDQVDLARGVLLSQLGNSNAALRKIRSYEAAIDLMALQILTRISLNDPPKKKIKEINRFVFEEIGFRFPPHSTYSKNVDLYTFLPSVLDSRQGVCLGVSLLYISLAQRLNLPLEIVTPPGHIFVRWKQGNDSINIETTARGIHLPDSEYLGVDTRFLQQRNIKETIGMAHFNQASVFWERQEYDKSFAAYLLAERYLPNDKHLLELKAYCAILQGDEKLGKELLGQVLNYLPDFAISNNTMAEDYINGHVGAEGIKAMFIYVDKTRESLLNKKKELQRVLEKYPQFREGIFSLAGTWLQLHRDDEALKTLRYYHEIDTTNATVEYYLSVLHGERLDYNRAWQHLRIAEALTRRRDHRPKALAELRKELASLCPE